MANKFGARSLHELSTCHEKLQVICHEALKIMDFSVICGHRGEEDQNRAFAEGKSNAKFGESSHNEIPSMAMDLAPYPLNWEDTNRFCVLAGVIKAVAYKFGIKIKWGGDFKSIKGDLGHFELEVL